MKKAKVSGSVRTRNVERFSHQQSQLRNNPLTRPVSPFSCDSSLWRLLLLLAFLVPLATISGCAGLAGSVSNNPGPSTLSITNVQAISTTTTGAQVSWTTNVAANSVVNYGTTTSYGSSTPVDSTMVTHHAVAISGLAAGTTYYYQVQSTDSKSNNGKSGGHKFATASVSISGTITPTQGGSAATVTLSGTASASTTTNSSGAYTFTGLASGSYAVTPSNAGYSFTPANQNVSLTATNATAVNFSATATASAPAITTQPANQMVTTGQTATFTVVASGTAPLNYQWQKNGTNIAGATSSNYTTPAATTADSGSAFRVVVTNSAGTVTSSAATLTVNAAAVAPTITKQPTNLTVTAGQTATFTVMATGTAPLSYQWQKNSANISGATSSSYTTPVTTASDSGSTYKVVVGNTAGTATSNAATLTVNAAAVAPAITTQPSSQTVTAGQTATFSVTATGTAPLSYQWQKNGLNIAGATSSTYMTPVTTTADSGSTIDVVVSNSAGTATSDAATLTVNVQSSGGNPTCGISGDTSNHIPTDWSTFVPPAKGQSYVDSSFGCTVTRITDASFNANDSYLMLADGWNRHFVTDLTGNIVVSSSNMPASNDTWFLWDASNASVFYYTNGNSLMKGTISGSSVATTSVRQFSEYPTINFMDETDVSQDGAHVVVIGGDTSGSSPENVFVYNLANNTKGPVYTTSCTGSVNNPNNGCLHKLIQTPDNNVIIQFASDGSGPEQGNRLWAGTYPLPHLQDQTNHLDAGYDLNGNAIFIESGNSNYTSGFSNPCPSGWGLDVRQVHNTSASTCLLDNPPSWHVGYRGNSQQPWVGLSFFDVRGSSPEWFGNSPNYVAPSASTWLLYEDEIMVARIDANNNSNQVYRLARAYSRSGQDFNATPKAAISRDGRYLAFDSNMAYAHSGCPANFQTGTNCVDVYVIKVQ